MNNLINSLKEENEKNQNYISRLEKVVKEFPDIREYRGRWSKWLCSKSVNSIATKADFSDSCGCCPDAVLYVMPFVEREDFRIYSDPAQITIGQMSFYTGYEAYKDWRETLKKYDINSAIYPLIEQYFKENPPGRIVYEED